MTSPASNCATSPTSTPSTSRTLNCNKRSITLNTKTERGKEILTELIRRSDVMVENFGPGAVDRMGFTWDRIQEINPRIVYASIKGFGDGPYTNFKAYEVVAQAMGGSMSTTGFEDGPPLATGAQIGDSGTGVHAVAGILAALYQRENTGRGQRVNVAMQHAVLNLCRVKLRDQQRLTHGPLAEYPNDDFGVEVPRSGNASGGGQPGWAVKCAPGGPNDYVYVIVQPVGWKPITELIGRPELADDPERGDPGGPAAAAHQDVPAHRGVVGHASQVGGAGEAQRPQHPRGPILSTKEIIEDESLVANEMVVSVPHPERGEFVTVGSPLKLSDSPVDVTSSPLLGEHNEEVYIGELGLGDEELRLLKSNE